MSWWTHINGAIIVSPMGRTQPEKRYILDTVLEHLPRVTGSEGDMETYVVQRTGHDSSSSCDEFGARTNNLVDWYGYKSRNGSFNIQLKYVIVVCGGLRDRCLEETKREFMNWLCRLAKRVNVWNVLVRINDDCKSMIIDDDGEKFIDMFEDPSWSWRNKEHEPTWCEYLMWESAKDSELPLELLLKYYDCPEYKAEFNRRLTWKYGKDG